MRIRAAQVNDARAIIRFNKKTIKKVNAKDYPPKIIRAWAKALKISHLKKRLEAGNRKVFVATENGKIIGFIGINPETRRIQALYVDHQHIRKGIGKKLLVEGEKQLRSLGVKKSTIHCSITGIPFYESQGYTRIQWSHTELGGVKIKDLIMEKNL